MDDAAADEPSGYVNQELRPMHDIAEIFADLTGKALATGLSDALKHLGSQKLKVATMCSGTESPILALRMIREHLMASGHHFNFHHVFSAEIEAFKQAYIERNFHTDIIFRDIREIAANEEASTAYGALASIPGRGAVDLLVAGFSCVDFSNLSRKQRLLDGRTKKAVNEASQIGIDDIKQMRKPPRVSGRTMNTKAKGVTDDDTTAKVVRMPPPQAIMKTIAGYDSITRGESGDTLFAILSYAGKYRPPLVILENVCGAPWGEIEEEWNRVGYAAEFIKLDTKQYYIPHTRNRFYMLCIDVGSTLGNGANKAARKWLDVVGQFERPASSPVDAFLFDELDPRLHRATAEINKGASSNERPSKEVVWAKCQLRHLQFREEHKLGNSRPFTNWVENGPSKMVDYGNGQWMKKQVNRIKDFFELYCLRAATLGYDPGYKARYPDVSQNIDRTKVDGAWGVTGCVTPSGMPFSTMRGGLIVGSEALALQGISVDKLHLTSETLSQLQNLAGNAMTSTVVGAAILSALIVAHQAIPKTELKLDDEAITQLYDQLPNSAYLQNENSIEFGPEEEVAVRDLFEMASLSARRCMCEGQSSTTKSEILVCTKCFHTACRKCAGIPKHAYLPPRAPNPRVQPTEFTELMKKALPMRLILTEELNVTLRNAQRTFKGTLESWDEYYAAAQGALTDEYYFHSSKRAEYWKFLYEGRCSRLELEMVDMQPQWFLYAKADPELSGNSKLRKLLELPIARMTTDGQSLLSGLWQVRLPATLRFQIKFRGAGERVQSWKSRLGLIESTTSSATSPAVASSLVSSSLVPSSWIVEVRNAQQLREWNIDVAGRYEFLPECGTANGCLHKRSEEKGNHKYLFLDPERVGEPIKDQFVFSSSHRRLYYGEKRRIDAKVDSTWRPAAWPLSLSHIHKDLEPPKMLANCTANGYWIDSNATLLATHGSGGTFAVLSNDAADTICETMDCTAAAITFLSCRAATDVSVVQRELVDHTNERKIFTSSAWLTERIRHLQGFSTCWRSFKVLKPESNVVCPKCAPAIPTISWKASDRTPKKPRGKAKNNESLIVDPYEEPLEAIRYEKAIKARPQPIRTYVKHEDEIVSELEISLNIPALVHRVLSKFSGSQQTVMAHWRLDTNYNFSKAAYLPGFVIPNNNDDHEEPYTFRRNRAVLRPEQGRSLRWMLKQETDSITRFEEEEIEEACLPYLGWRVQTRVTRVCPARGGLLADKVGYGKTITTLALIDKTRGRPVPAIKSRISLKATLVVTPYLLTTQWQSEIKKFLASDYHVLLIRGKPDLSKYTVSDFVKADIIIVAYSIFTSDALLERIARFASLPDPPASVQSRAYAVWLANAKERIQKNMDRLMASPFPLGFQHKLNKDLAVAQCDPDLQRRIPSKRYKGAAYQVNKPDFGKAPSSVVDAATKSKSTLKDDPFNLGNVKDVSGLKGPLFQMFQYHRIVVDEYTYASPKECDFLRSLHASSRWILSGTPAIDNFADVKALATLIGVTLGADNDAGDAFKSQNVKSSGKDRTAAETFRSLCQNQSQGWYEDRHTHAQEFLDVFARQNEPVVELPETYHIHKQCILSSSERARYIELQVRLYGQEMQLRGGKGINVDNDHVRRLFEEITSSQSSEEALLKSCTRSRITARNKLRYRMEARPLIWEGRSKLTPLEEPEDKFNASAEIIEARTSQVRTQLIDLRAALQIAEREKRRLDSHDTHYAAWKTYVRNNAYGDEEVTNALLELIDIASKAALSILDTDKVVGKKEVDKAVKALRDRKEKLHMKATEYVARKRMLRFFLSLHQIRQWASSGAFEQHCTHPPVHHIRELHLLGQCGHIRCQACLNMGDISGAICGVRGCSAGALDYHIIYAEDLLAGDTDVKGPVYYGKKIEDIIQMIKQIRDQKGQILLFVQFVDMMATLAGAFRASGITFSTITGESKDAKKEDKMMQEFKDGAKDKAGTPKVTVLMLNAGTACAAGHNLTSANHVMFISPLHEETQHAFNQAYEQAIGRARRFGQTANVIKVYYFLATKTIDVNIFEDRKGVKLVLNSPTGDFELVDRTKQTPSQLAQDYATLRLSDFSTVGEEM
ncbi:hypothetical protein MMC18_002641 [Xylographa bjoerkii]|nr:hypothetical protein [Xylographa bjoerkii]